MSQTLSLYRLQQVDSQIDQLKTRLLNIEQILADDSELCRLKDIVQTSDLRCKNAKQALKKAEHDVVNQTIKIEQTQADLYGGKFHSPKELQDLQNEFEALKRYLVVLEDRQLDSMQESETADDENVKAQEELKAFIDRSNDRNESLQQECALHKNELERLYVERNAIAEAIPETEIDLYNGLRQQRRGIAVASISDNSCGACGATLSLAQIQSARSSDDMKLCPSCGRILYGN